MFIVANLGINWWSKGHSDERSLELLKAAKDAGAHGICIPYLKSDKLYRGDDIKKKVRKFDVPPELLYDMQKWAKEDGMQLWVAPSWHEDVAYLETINVDGYHIQNGDIGYEPLIRAIAETDKPIMMSTGFASFDEINDAVELIFKIRAQGNENFDISDLDLVLLHSTGPMPTMASEAQLGRILDLAAEFMPLYVGYESFLSTANTTLDYIAMAYNPAIIMRRLDLDDRKGVETEYSLTPALLRQLVEIAVGMEWVNNPVDYADGFTEGDFDARIKRLRCKESDYLLPPSG